MTYDGAPALLLSSEGSGDVYRLDHLPRGPLRGSTTVSPGQPAAGLVVTREFTPIPAIRRMLAEEGTAVPVSGKGPSSTSSPRTTGSQRWASGV